MNEMEKLIPLFQNLSDGAMTAFILWWVGQYIIPFVWFGLGVTMLWLLWKKLVDAIDQAERKKPK